MSRDNIMDLEELASGIVEAASITISEKDTGD
jgi:hypothetical protein